MPAAPAHALMPAAVVTMDGQAAKRPIVAVWTSTSIEEVLQV